MPGVSHNHHPCHFGSNIAGAVGHGVFDLVSAVQIHIHRVGHFDVLRDVAVNVVGCLRSEILVRLLEFLLHNSVANQRDHGRYPVHDDDPANELLRLVTARVDHVVQHHVIAGSGRIHLVVHLDLPGQVPFKCIRCRRPGIRIFPAHLHLQFNRTHECHLRPPGIPHRHVSL